MRKLKVIVPSKSLSSAIRIQEVAKTQTFVVSWSLSPTRSLWQQRRVPAASKASSFKVEL